MHQQSTRPHILTALAALALIGVVVVIGAAALMGSGFMERTPQRLLGVAVAVGLLVLAFLRLLLEIAAARQGTASDLRASELTTLSFPPESRVQRSNLQRTH